MQSFIVISKNKEKAKELVNQMASDLKISKFDIYSFESEKAVGIADIRKW